jgi:hypothetical protein
MAPPLTSNREAASTSAPAVRVRGRAAFGHHYPALALLGVSALFVDAAKIELVGVAVILPSR